MEKILDKSPQTISQMFSALAPRYDLMNNLMTGFSHHLTRRFALSLAELTPDQRTLDLATGTGDFASLLDTKADVIGCDLSDGMLRRAKIRSRQIEFLRADISVLPFPNNLFDVCAISYGIRNVKDPHAVLREIFRITRPGGRLIIVEASIPENPTNRFLVWFHFTRIVPFLARIFTTNPTAFDYYFKSVEQFPTGRKFFILLKKAGWNRVWWYKRLFGAVSIYQVEKRTNPMRKAH